MKVPNGYQSYGRLAEYSLRSKANHIQQRQVQYFIIMKSFDSIFLIMFSAQSHYRLQHSYITFYSVQYYRTQVYNANSNCILNSFCNRNDLLSASLPMKSQKRKRNQKIADVPITICNATYIAFSSIIHSSTMCIMRCSNYQSCSCCKITKKCPAIDRFEMSMGIDLWF